MFPMEGGVTDMGKGFIKWVGGIFVAAIANCVAGHLVDCMFERVGLPCPRPGTA